MSGGRLRALIAVLVALAALLWLRHHFSPEARLARSLQDLARAAEEEKLLAVAQHISRRYSDERGLTYESFLGGVADLFASKVTCFASVGLASAAPAPRRGDIETTLQVGTQSSNCTLE